MKNRIKRSLRILLALIGLSASLALVAAIAYLLSDHTNGSIISSGRKRSYLLYVPKTYNPATPTPLVISIHGYAEWPAHQAQLSRWNDLADQYGFIVVYPSGTGLPKRWQARGASGSDPDSMLDVTFISDLIDKLETEYNLDPARIYANGLSNGGGMTFVLSCILSERIAAIGTVSGAFMFPWDECQPSRTVPTIVFHGTADPIVPYQGGPSDAFDLPFPAIPDWVNTLAHRNGCTGAPLEIPASGNVSGIKYNNCAASADVIFYTIAGGGHSWPGGVPMPKFIVGNTTQDIDATKTMWKFFQQHPLPGK
jgi:polyhydroxybutyrate depolymerase